MTCPILSILFQLRGSLWNPLRLQPAIQGARTRLIAVEVQREVPEMGRGEFLDHQYGGEFGLIH